MEVHSYDALLLVHEKCEIFQFVELLERAVWHADGWSHSL